MNFNNIIKKLKERKETISTMESCTGGGVANAITNCDGSSKVIKFSAVTYSNEYKIKFGVKKEIIDKYTVYSLETAKAMAKAISDFTQSDYGVGITGKLNKIDPKNLTGEDNIVFISIYNKQSKEYVDNIVRVSNSPREKTKQEVINVIIKTLENILKK